MASRKDQKDQLRRERMEREAAAKAAERRRRMIGYGAGLVLVIAALVVGVVLLSGGDDGGSGGGNVSEDSNVLPDGGEVPEQQSEDLQQAMAAADCELTSKRATSRDHTEDPAEQVTYSTNPPSSGKHFAQPAEDGIYEGAKDVKEYVHSLEHGRVIIWFKKDLPEEARANLRALVDDDHYHMILVPDETDMPYDVAATAWNDRPAAHRHRPAAGLPRVQPPRL